VHFFGLRMSNKLILIQGMEHIYYQKPLNFNFELNSYTSLKELCSYYFATESLLLSPVDLLQRVHSTSFRIFDLPPGVQTISCS
jgi:hypothetical protein